MTNNLQDKQGTITCFETISVQDGKGLMRHTLIKQLDHGYIVEVGCKSFAIPTKDQLCKLLIRYINNPATMEKEYYDGKLFKQTNK